MAHSKSPRQKRLVRDYSTDGMMAPPRRFHTYAEEDRRRRLERERSDHENPQNISEEVEEAREAQDPVDEAVVFTAVTENYEPSTSTRTAVSASPDPKIANFFGSEVFQLVLQNPTTLYQLKKYAQSRLCEENLDFLDMLRQYQQSLNQVSKTALEIHQKFVSNKALSQVNLPEEVLTQVDKNLKKLLTTSMPSMESAFLSAQQDIEKLVASDMYPGFVRQQMTKSAVKALATNKYKYAGLGDCFVLTNPNKADNPIVYASDGFVKVTGYRRDEIIPRNCRFLQGGMTDRESIARVKKSIEAPAEHVELILNLRKDGEPFWNLLYTAPLYDAGKNLTFFIGGQVNISTAIHNTSDILRILSYGDEDVDEGPVPPPLKQSKSSFFGSLRKSRMRSAQTPGMEDELLGRFNTMSFPEQKNAFHSAYSKYLVINAETMLISYFSSGTLELLFPIKSTLPNSEIIGQDVFKFLTHHSQNSLPRDYKTNVKTAIRSGQAISMDLRLCTRRTMGFEQFLTHWTPLKDENNSAAFVILTFGSLRDVKWVSS